MLGGRRLFICISGIIDFVDVEGEMGGRVMGGGGKSCSNLTTLELFRFGFSLCLWGK